MIKSKYISDILELLLDGDIDGLSAKQQLPFITEDDFEYTGGGLFVRFSYSNKIINYKVLNPDLILNGVKIQTTEFPIEADATLFFRNGLINHLEIWCYLGDYPKQDLTKYTLTQIWENSNGKIITTEY
ncbi:hypothetical protein FAM09_15275 [Niastella caeni]|uniref:Uncharacterized protein n=1 Tax=Niastella caeni TaxID=2569763 RepID=A0A4S8HVH4_9BACT|nr:hypothetical protein [Niastella caeni]THU38044.1 hypothetical protein FAM09_15275 [Niastella caeni]